MYVSIYSLVVFFLALIGAFLWVAFCIFIVVTLSRQSTEMSRISSSLERIESLLQERSDSTASDESNI